MNTAVINIKTEPETKRKAHEVAQEIGISLSSLINAYLKELIKTRRVEFSAGEEPSAYLIKILKKAQENYKSGNTSPAFRTGEAAVAWLEKRGV